MIFPGEKNPKFLREYLNEFYLHQCNGILHIGANTGGESDYYSSLGKKVIWIEGDPEIFQKLKTRIDDFPDQIAICALLSNVSRIAPFYIADNDGLSSSLHPISKTGNDWTIQMKTSKNLQTSRLDELDISNFSDYDFWVIDVQGHEYEVLAGAANRISCAKWILVEISTKQFYENQKVFEDVDELLLSYGFIRLHDAMDEHCEILYMRTGVLSKTKI